MDENNFIVDRIEGSYAVLERSDGEIINIDLKSIEGKPSEGDMLVMINDVFKVDEAATLKRKNHISKLMRGMWVDE